VIIADHLDGMSQAADDDDRDDKKGASALGSPNGLRDRRRKSSTSPSDANSESDNPTKKSHKADEFAAANKEGLLLDKSNEPPGKVSTDDSSGEDGISEDQDDEKNDPNSKAAGNKRKQNGRAAESESHEQGQADAAGRNQNGQGQTDEKGQRPSYPPSKIGEGTTSQKAGEPPLRSLLSVRPMFSGLWRYTMAAKILCVVLVVHNAFSVMVVRQITALVNLPSDGAIDSSPLAKRAAGDELPFDIRYTQKWLAKMFGGQPDPILILTLLFTWVSMSILMSGVIYNAIIEKTENTPVVLSDEEKKAKWYNHKMDFVRRVGRWMKSCVISAVRLVLMDRSPSLGTFWANLGRWTGLRIAIFTVQLLIAIAMVRQVLAMASLVAGAETPIPSGLEITYTLQILKKALPIIQPFPGGMMLLGVFVLTAVIIIIPVGWHSLLHPRQKNPQSRTAGQTMKRILTCQAFGKGISLGKYRTPVMFLLVLILVASFGACLYYFVEIMRYIGEVGFIKDSGYMDSVGPFMIFGIFALPLAYIGFECEDAVRSALKNRTSKTTDNTK
jgi:hypothetical protein